MKDCEHNNVWHIDEYNLSPPTPITREIEL
jgi:hypothetical protein